MVLEVRLLLGLGGINWRAYETGLLELEWGFWYTGNGFSTGVLFTQMSSFYEVSVYLAVHLRFVGFFVCRL